ncbi:phosphate ABC transporter, permease protein [Gloeomargarita lithophora Alchichica-D10]|uniref:Phosphate transport system permease protein PstA n=1 Tax=Gloeomargarita lithophora Alchichica-D10 TaxID=1188229 RepID=A0A1J0AF08_9CYAN|nr:phosphate ABC transporter permease PstA [Gloeomargarita lithophora]APB34509.1 phosphate ABC transporter, permease protein [Gloeomargarita lithophora Alchichica-D10]
MTVTLPQSEGNFRSNYEGRKLQTNIFMVVAFLATIFGLFFLGILLYDVFSQGLSYFNWKFLTTFPSRNPEEAGVLSALVGSIWLMFLIPIFAFPLGIGAAVYMEEYADRDLWYNRALEINISNLAGVPSIIYGLLGLELYVRVLEPITKGRTLLAGALTLSTLVLPVVIISTREAIRAVPKEIREGAYGVGATRWQSIWFHVLPIAFPGILTGTILALSRAIGETAPLITLGALTFIAFLPPWPVTTAVNEVGLVEIENVSAGLGSFFEALQTPFTALPIQIFNWAGRPQVEFHKVSAAGIIALLGLLVAMNSVAVLLRARFQLKK